MITRIISGVLGIGIAAYVIQRGGTVFASAAAVLAVLAWFEYTRAFSHRGGNPALFSGLLGIGGMLYGAYLGQLDIVLMALTGASLLALLTSVLLRGDVSVPDVCASVAGIAYIGLPFAHLVMLRFLSGGVYVTPVETFRGQVTALPISQGVPSVRTSLPLPSVRTRPSRAFSAAWPERQLLLRGWAGCCRCRSPRWRGSAQPLLFSRRSATSWSPS